MKQNFYKRAANHYSHTNVHTYVHTMCMYIHTNAHLYVHVHSRGLNMEGEYVFGYGQYKYRGRLFFWLWIPPPDNGRNTKKQKSAHTPPKKNIILLFSSENGRHFVPLRRPKPRSVTSRRASRRSWEKSTRCSPRACTFYMSTWIHFFTFENPPGVPPRASTIFFLFQLVNVGNKE